MSVETEDTMRHTETLYIPLTQGKFAVIDTKDYYLIAGHSWSANKTADGHWYARAKINSCAVKMHQLLMGTTNIDHRDGDGLNNTRYNLRLCTRVQNQQNRKPRRDSMLPYKGVSFHVRQHKYQAQIQQDGLNIGLGYFDNPISAALAYDKAAQHRFGSFARPNWG